MDETSASSLKIAVIGAGWAGLSAAVQATELGHFATIFEASSAVGGRARGIISSLPNGTPVSLDNGQHILIGAYTETLRMMRVVGLEPSELLLDLPMTLQFPDGLGITFPNWATPLDALGGITRARGWSLADKLSLLRASLRWKLQGFQCDTHLSVAELCKTLSARVLAELIEPLCVSALNTPASQASASVFLRVLQDALFGVSGGSHLLLPKTDLSALFPLAAAAWSTQRGAQLRLSSRVDSVAQHGQSWLVNGEVFDAVILATSASNAAQVLITSAQYATKDIANKMQSWVTVTRALRFEAIATVYAWGAAAMLSQPMLALRSSPTAPAQFVFDRGQLGGPDGLLAFVVSASQGDRATLQAQVMAQAQSQWGFDLQAVLTVVEKRATFACVPNLQRPQPRIAPGLVACGDYVAGPYPATLEGAVRSGLAALATLTTDRGTAPRP
jgi:squalene-associated FAD-dependent desaturase